MSFVRYSIVDWVYWPIFLVTLGVLFWLFFSLHHLKKEVEHANTEILAGRSAVVNAEKNVAAARKQIVQLRTESDEKEDQVDILVSSFRVEEVDLQNEKNELRLATIATNTELKKQNALKSTILVLRKNIGALQDRLSNDKVLLDEEQGQNVLSRAEVSRICIGANWLKHHFRMRPATDAIMKTLNAYFNRCPSALPPAG